MGHSAQADPETVVGREAACLSGAKETGAHTHASRMLRAPSLLAWGRSQASLRATGDRILAPGRQQARSVQSNRPWAEILSSNMFWQQR